MPAPRQLIETAPGLGLGFGLWQDQTAARDHRITGKDNRAFRQVKLTGCNRLFMRHAARIISRQFAAMRGFVNIGGKNQVGNNPDLRQQVETTRRGRGENQRGSAAVHPALHGCHPRLARISQSYLKRNVIRPLVRS